MEKCAFYGFDGKVLFCGNTFLRFGQKMHFTVLAKNCVLRFFTKNVFLRLWWENGVFAFLAEKCIFGILTGKCIFVGKCVFMVFAKNALLQFSGKVPFRF